MSAHIPGRQGRSLAPLIAVTVAALAFAILLILVRLQWPPLESLDHGAAARLNSLIAGNSTLVTVVKAVAWLGSDGVLWGVVGAAAIILALRRRWRLAIYLLLTGAGALVLDPILKSLVGRLRRTAAGILVAWVLILGVVVGAGELVTKAGNGNVLGDRTIPHWFAAHRTPGWNHWSQIFSTLGATQAILIVSVATCAVFLAVTRRWRPVIYIATVMSGELAAFLAAAAVVKRPRPDVTQLDQHLPTPAYPSGHEAATCCLYVAVAILVIGHARGWWRWLFLVPAIAMPALVAISRMYRGEHHPTDILGSLLFSALWLTAVSMLIRPNAGAHFRARRDTSRDRRVAAVPGSTARRAVRQG